MATVSEPESDARSEAGNSLADLKRKLFRYDWVTSLMLASIVMIGGLVLWLAAIWITNQVWRVHTPVVGVDLIQIADGDGEEGMAGDDPELGEGQVVAPDILSPAEENLAFDSPEVADVMSNVLDAIAQNEADYLDPSRQEGQRAAGRGGAPGGTGKKGTGEGGSTLPRALRWSINYTNTQTLASYARLLDYFKIELGVARGTERIVYVSNFSRGSPVIQRGGATEERLYFLWKDAGRRKADMDLLAKAKVPTDNATIVQFFPAGLEDQLAKLERDYKGKEPKEIRQTRFGVRRKGDGFEFYVIDQSYIR